jgi:nitrogen regulatory protein PII
MQLLVAVINAEDSVDAVLAGFVELGITGATVLDSRGMGRLLLREMPILAGIGALRSGTRAANHTVLCVMDDDKVDAAFGMVQEVCGDLTAPGTGILFTVPVSRVVGLAPELAP